MTSQVIDNITGVFENAYGKAKELGKNALGTVSGVATNITGQSSVNSYSTNHNPMSNVGGKQKVSKRAMKKIKTMNKTLQNKIKSAASYNLAASIGGRRHHHRGGYYNYAVTSNAPSGIYDIASPYPGESYGTPMPLPRSDPMPSPSPVQVTRGGNTQTVQLPAGGIQVNVKDAAGNTTGSVGVALPSPVNLNVKTGGRRHKSRRHSRKGGKGRKGGKTQKGCSKKSYGGKRSRKSHKYYTF